MNYKRKSSKVQAIQLTGNVDIGNGYAGKSGDWLVIDYDNPDHLKVKTYTDELFKSTFELDYSIIRLPNPPWLSGYQNVRDLGSTFPMISTCSAPVEGKLYQYNFNELK